MEDFISPPLISQVGKCLACGCDELRLDPVELGGSHILACADCRKEIEQEE